MRQKFPHGVSFLSIRCVNLVCGNGMKFTCFWKLNPLKYLSSIDLWRYDEPINPRMSY